MAHLTNIRVSVVDQTLKIVDAPVVASGGKNEVRVVFDFCEKWNGLEKTAIFYVDESVPYYAICDAEDTCIVPWEVYADPGTFYFGVFGENGDIIKTSFVAKYKVRNGAIFSNMRPSDPTPDVYAQIMDKLKDGGGLSPRAAELLIGILRNAAYPANTNQSTNITALAALLGVTENGVDGGGSGDDGEIPHAHSYTSAVTTAATCAAAGVKTYTCSCGESYTEVIPPTGHSYVNGVCTVCGKPDPEAESGGSGSGESGDGVGSINYLAARVDGALNTNYIEPENGYVIVTNTDGHTAYGTGISQMLAWPLIAGKTYSISVANADTTNQYYGLCASTLDTTPVKGEITTVTDTVVKNITAWGWTNAGSTKSYSYTAGDNEYLLFWPNKAGVLTITAEVTA